MRVLALILVMSPAHAELTLLEHRTLFEVVGLAIAPAAGRSTGLTRIESRVAQLLARDAYFGLCHAWDLVSSMDACHHAFVGVCLC